MTLLLILIGNELFQCDILLITRILLYDITINHSLIVKYYHNLDGIEISLIQMVILSN